MVALELSCPACGKLPSQHDNNECVWRFSPAKWERLPSNNDEDEYLASHWDDCSE
jgi:hypothetical protein